MAFDHRRDGNKITVVSCSHRPRKRGLGRSTCPSVIEILILDLSWWKQMWWYDSDMNMDIDIKSYNIIFHCNYNLYLYLIYDSWFKIPLLYYIYIMILYNILFYLHLHLTMAASVCPLQSIDSDRWATDDWLMNENQVVGFAADERYRQGREALQYADVYHSATRYGTGERNVPIVLPRSTVWTFGRQRLILGRESLAIQGHAVNAHTIGVAKLSEAQLQDLAGNSFLGHESWNNSLSMWGTGSRKPFSRIDSLFELQTIVSSVSRDVPFR